MSLSLNLWVYSKTYHTHRLHLSSLRCRRLRIRPRRRIALRVARRFEQTTLRREKHCNLASTVLLQHRSYTHAHRQVNVTTINTVQSGKHVTNAVSAGLPNAGTVYSNGVYAVSQKKTNTIIFVITTSNFHQMWQFIFGTKMANSPKLYEIHSFFASPNSRQCTIVLIARRLDRPFRRGLQSRPKRQQ